jgi:AraC-like DNA-binding protein
LRSGQSVARTAHAVGYKSASAFIHAFGVAHGMSPHTWIKARQAQDPQAYLPAPQLEQQQLSAG